MFDGKKHRLVLNLIMFTVSAILLFIVMTVMARGDTIETKTNFNLIVKTNFNLIAKCDASFELEKPDAPEVLEQIQPEMKKVYYYKNIIVGYRRGLFRRTPITKKRKFYRLVPVKSTDSVSVNMNTNPIKINTVKKARCAGFT